MPAHKAAPAVKALSTDKKIADDYDADEIKEHSARALSAIQSVNAEWPGLVKLPASDKSGNLGKLVGQLGGPLKALFTALTPSDKDDHATRESKAKLATVFDAMMGKSDRGKDPLHFEVDLLLRRMERVQAELKIAEALKEARQRFVDDAMNTGEMVVEPGLRALEIARTAASSNEEFRSLLAPVLDGLSDMTKRARQYQEEARKAAQDAAANAPAEDTASADVPAKGTAKK
ncbi:MAG: hypothetical protein U0441_05725 [Polyangiaceae bacterium]